MVYRIIAVICLTIITMRHIVIFKSEKANEIFNGVSFVAVLALAFCISGLSK